MKNIFRQFATQSRPLLSVLCTTALVAVIGLSFTACGDGSGDNGNGNGNNNNSGSGSGVPTELLGTWVSDYVYYDSHTVITHTFTANSLVQTSKVDDGITYTHTFTVISYSSVTQTNDNSANKIEFPSGYHLVMKITDVNPPKETQQLFYLNTAKNKFWQGGNPLEICTKQ
jgi:hypothetical protein